MISSHLLAPHRVGTVLFALCVVTGCGIEPPEDRTSISPATVVREYQAPENMPDTDLPAAIRLLDWVDDVAVRSGHDVQIAGITRTRLEPVRTSQPKQLVLGEDSRSSLDAILDGTELHPEAIGVAVSFSKVPYPDPWQPRDPPHYVYIDRDTLERRIPQSDIPVPVVPEGSEAGEYTVVVRQLLPLDRDFVFEDLTLPSDARLVTHVGFWEQWECAEAATVAFCIAARVDGEVHVLHRVEQSIQPDVEQRAWTEVVVDLKQFAGMTVDLVLSTRLESSSESSLKVASNSPMFGSPIIFTERPEAPNRKNVILISLDTLGARHLPTYGYARNTAPNLDAFAQKSVVFEQCISASPWTVPSHASVFTGLHPAVHGAGTHARGYRLRGEFVTLAELARMNGSLTTAITDGGPLSGRIGFSQGFDEYRDGSNGAHDADIEVTVAETIAWLEEFHDYPFFLFVHSFQVHDPYDPPEGFRGMFGGDAVVHGDHTKAKTESERAVWIARYDEEIAYLDHTLARLFEALDRMGLYDNTLVVIFSDHGEQFWEHGVWGHIEDAYDEVLEVPLIIRFPGGEHAGKRVARPVAARDIFGTIATFMDWDLPVPRPSLMSLIDGSGTDYRTTIYSLLPHHFEAERRRTGRIVEFMTHAVRRDGRKAIFSDKAYLEQCLAAGDFPTARGRDRFHAEFYDLTLDPLEQIDISDDHPENVDAYWNRLTSFLEQRTGESRPGVDPARDATTLDESAAEKLEMMGYL